jgi:hypothetical protein
MNIKNAVPFLLMASCVTNYAVADTQKVYGRIWLALNSSDNGLISYRKENGTGIESYSSYLGIKGDQKINDNLKVIYKFEVTNTGGYYESSKTFSPKNNYLGFENGYGEITFGRNDSVFKTTEGKIDLFNITSSDMATMIPGNDRLYDVATLYTKKYMNLKFGVTYQFSSEYSGNDIAYAAYYGDPSLKNDNYYIAVAYADGLNGLKSERFSYSGKISQIKIGLIYQHSKSLIYENLKGNSYLASISYKVGNGEILGQYSRDNSGLGLIASQITSKKNIEDYDGYIATLGYGHSLSKSTTVYTYYSYTSNSEKYSSAEHHLYDNAVNVSMKYIF